MEPISLIMSLAGLARSFSIWRTGDANYRNARREAKDILARGEEEADRYQMDLSGFLGTQRATLAASMLDVGFGSAKQVKEQTERFGEQDLATIRLNATRAAWGVMRNARTARRAARGEAILGGVQAATPVLLNGVNKAWDRYRASRNVTYNQSYGPPRD